MARMPRPRLFRSGSAGKTTRPRIPNRCRRLPLVASSSDCSPRSRFVLGLRARRQRGTSSCRRQGHRTTPGICCTNASRVDAPGRQSHRAGSNSRCRFAPASHARRQQDTWNWRRQGHRTVPGHRLHQRQSLCRFGFAGVVRLTSCSRHCHSELAAACVPPAGHAGAR